MLCTRTAWSAAAAAASASPRCPGRRWWCGCSPAGCAAAGGKAEVKVESCEGAAGGDAAGAVKEEDSCGEQKQEQDKEAGVAAGAVDVGVVACKLEACSGGGAAAAVAVVVKQEPGQAECAAGGAGAGAGRAGGVKQEEVVGRRACRRKQVQAGSGAAQGEGVAVKLEQ